MNPAEFFPAINPYTGQLIATYPEMVPAEVERVLDRAYSAQQTWRQWSVVDRARCLRALAVLFSTGREVYASRMALEMGKVLREARAEIDKCSRACDFFADHGPLWLRSEPVATEALSSYIEYTPLGIVLAIMPWNFPFWQFIRACLPALLAGNGVLLKHAPNVPGCASDLEDLFREAGFPEGLVSSLRVGVRQIPAVIEDRRVAALTVTGSVRAGRILAGLAGGALKKCVLELGGSDPFVVLHDADIEEAAEAAVASRFQNCGQSCIAAKRLIVVGSVCDAFEQALVSRIRSLRIGDPLQQGSDMGPMARSDLRETLHAQVKAAQRLGADVAIGGAMPEGAGFLYPPTLLMGVKADSPVAREEVFGPVAAVIPVRDESEAVRVANDTVYGLAASVWTADSDQGARVASRIESGPVFVNRVPFSDPRLPFGGIKQSGYGRELSRQGMLEFCNARSVWIDRS